MINNFTLLELKNILKEYEDFNFGITVMSYKKYIDNPYELELFYEYIPISFCNFIYSMEIRKPSLKIETFLYEKKSKEDAMNLKFRHILTSDIKIKDNEKIIIEGKDSIHTHNYFEIKSFIINKKEKVCIFTLDKLQDIIIRQKDYFRIQDLREINKYFPEARLAIHDYLLQDLLDVDSQMFYSYFKQNLDMDYSFCKLSKIEVSESTITFYAILYSEQTVSDLYNILNDCENTLDFTIKISVEKKIKCSVNSKMCLLY